MTLTPKDLSAMIVASLECAQCSEDGVCASHFEVITLACRSVNHEPTEREINALAQHLWGQGCHGRLNQTWQQLPHAAKRQWREDARRYLTIAARAEQA